MKIIKPFCGVIFSAFLAIIQCPVYGLLVKKPKDTVVPLGSKVQLKCATDEKYSVNWQHIPVGSEFSEDVYISKVVVLPYYPRFAVDKTKIGNSNTEYFLTIKSVKREDAGLYSCIDKAGHGERAEAELIILEANVSCGTNIGRDGFVGENDCGEEADQIKCSCSINYFGNRPPWMEWRNSTGELFEPQPPSYTSNKYSVSSNLTIKAKSNLNGTAIFWYSKDNDQNIWMSENIQVVDKRKLCSVTSRDEEPGRTEPAEVNTLDVRSILILLSAVVAAIITASLAIFSIICIVRRKNQNLNAARIELKAKYRREDKSQVKSKIESTFGLLKTPNAKQNEYVCYELKKKPT